MTLHGLIRVDTTENTKPTYKMAKYSQRLVAELRHLTPVSYRRLKVNFIAILYQIFRALIHCKTRHDQPSESNKQSFRWSLMIFSEDFHLEGISPYRARPPAFHTVPLFTNQTHCLNYK